MTTIPARAGAMPLATLAKARDTIRLSRKAGKEPITVHLLDGDVLFGLEARRSHLREDSGSAESPITYAGEHEGRAIVSGAVASKGLARQPAQ